MKRQFHLWLEIDCQDGAEGYRRLKGALKYLWRVWGFRALRIEEVR